MEDDGFDLFFSCTYRLMGELKSKYVKVDKSAEHRMRVAEGLLEEEQKLSLRQMPRVFDEKLTSSKLKLTPHAVCDSHCSACRVHDPSKAASTSGSTSWQHQLAACAALRGKSEEDIEMTKQEPWS